ncbi:hypothetical protein [Hymenobacter psoromatis]|uniref:hypothetical protein n=1 Tax=Hymenobacter psoromatis TaxID=1484116 RepID=UPI001CBF4D7F|nr:hypothetical protein [Hymenobacter psoromatis]
MRQYDDPDEDALDDDDNLDAYASTGGAKTKGLEEDQLSAKYADYLMWRDTGSSHDEALDLATMTEEEFTTAQAAEDPDGSSSHGSLDDDDDDPDADEDDGAYGSSRGRGDDYDSDF